MSAYYALSLWCPRNHAEAVGVVKREGKIQIPSLGWSFRFGFATGERRSQASGAVTTPQPTSRYLRAGTPQWTTSAAKRYARHLRAGVDASVP